MLSAAFPGTGARLLASLAGAVLLLLAGGCVFGRRCPVQYYRLSAIPGADAAPAAGLPAVTSLRVELPDYLLRQDLVETRGRNRMELRGDARWGHSLPQGMEDVLRFHLAWIREASRGTGNPPGEPSPGEDAPGVRLDYVFWEFAGDRSGVFRAEGFCRAAETPSRRRLRFRFSFVVPYDAGDTDSLVHAHDQALRRIAAETARRLASGRPGE